MIIIQLTAFYFLQWRTLQWFHSHLMHPSRQLSQEHMLAVKLALYQMMWNHDGVSSSECWAQSHAILCYYILVYSIKTTLKKWFSIAGNSEYRLYLMQVPLVYQTSANKWIHVCANWVHFSNSNSVDYFKVQMMFDWCFITFCRYRYRYRRIWWYGVIQMSLPCV